MENERPFNLKKVPSPQIQIEHKMTDIEPWYLEIGSGTGDFALSFGKKNKDSSIIAIERTKEKFRKMKNKLEQMNLPHVYPYHCDAIPFICHHVPNKSLNAVYINYPNPYPKYGQRNKRFHHMPFFKILWQKIKWNGRLYQSTNDLTYYLDSLETFRKVWNLRPFQMSVFDQKTKPNFRPRTAFELKYFERGETLYHIVYQKN